VAARRLDVAVGLLVASVGLVATAVAGGGWLDVVAAAAIGGSFGLARARPTAAWVVAGAVLAGLVVAIAGSVGPTSQQSEHSFVVLLIAVTAFGAGRWAPRVSATAAALTLIVLLLVYAAEIGDSAAPYILLPGLAWFAARALRERALLAAGLAERARELEEEHEAYAELSVRYERSRIAAELHDIVAHAMSVMVVQASAGQRLAASDPELTAETFDAIAGAAHQAEADIGRLVTLLADEHTSDRAPDLDLVEELVARAAGTGLDVTLTLDGDRDGLPNDLVQTATRVVQEGLTNALRYASGASVRVLIDGTPDGVIVEVANDSTPSAPVLSGYGTGNGLRGLRERLSACGGQLEAGPTSDGGWQTRAYIPSRVKAAGR